MIELQLLRRSQLDALPPEDCKSYAAKRQRLRRAAPFLAETPENLSFPKSLAEEMMGSGERH
jgi:hypothetical protein